MVVVSGPCESANEQAGVARTFPSKSCKQKMPQESEGGQDSTRSNWRIYV